LWNSFGAGATFPSEESEKSALKALINVLKNTILKALARSVFRWEFSVGIATLDCAMSSKGTPRVALPMRVRPAGSRGIERVARGAPVIFAHPSWQESFLGLNPTEGCLHQCPFCAVRWQKNGLGEAVAGRLY